MNIFLLLCIVTALVSCTTAAEDPIVPLVELPPTEDFYAHYGTWNTDGSKIVFSHTDDSGNIPRQNQIYVYDLNSKERYKIFDGPGLNPDWSPDEQWITFHTGSIPEIIYKYAPASDSLVQLTGEGTPADFRNTSIARWSPDGSRILFTIIAGTPRGLVTMSAEGEDAEIIVPIAVGGNWFPDGEHIVYVNWDNDMPNDRQRQLHMSNSDGSNPVKLTDLENSMYVSSPDVSPDGTKVVFVHQPTLGTLELYLLDLRDRSVTQLTHTPREILTEKPQWHPDGIHVLFTAIEYRPIRSTSSLYTINTLTGKISAVFP